MSAKKDIDLLARKKELQETLRKRLLEEDNQLKISIGQTVINAGGLERFPTLTHIAGLVHRGNEMADANHSFPEECRRRGDEIFRRKSIAKPKQGHGESPNNGAVKPAAPEPAAKPAKPPKKSDDLLPGIATD